MLAAAIHRFARVFRAVRFELETDIRVLLFQLAPRQRRRRAQQTIYSRYVEFRVAVLHFPP